MAENEVIQNGFVPDDYVPPQVANEPDGGEPLVEGQEGVKVEEPTPAVAPETPEVVIPQVKVEEPAQEEVDYYEKLGFPKGGGEYKKYLDAAKAGREELRKFTEIAFTDYEKIADKDILRMKFDQANQTLTAEQREKLFQSKLERTYGLTGDDEVDEIALLEMKSDANEFRNGLKKAQADYQIPEQLPKQEAKTNEIDPQVRQQYVNDYLTSEAAKGFETNRTVTFGDGEESFKFEVGKDIDVKNIILDNLGAIFTPFQKEVNGKSVIDYVGLQKLITYAFNMKAVEQGTFNQGVALGTKRYIEGNLKGGVPNPTGVAPDGTVQNGFIN